MSEVQETESARRVLVVDDEPYIRKAIYRMLQKHKLKLLEAGTGEQALDLLNSNLVDVVLLDVRLPDINGIDVLKHTKSIDPEIVVIIMTAHGTVNMAVEAMKEGAFEFLTKPFETPELVPITVQRALQYKYLLEANRKLEGMVSNQQ
ncbi:MAG: response regulator, partial [bacterium]